MKTNEVYKVAKNAFGKYVYSFKVQLSILDNKHGVWSCWIEFKIHKSSRNV